MSLTAIDSPQVYLKCVGALGALYGVMAFRMSLYRVAGSPGEDEPCSPLSRFHVGQMLAAEWIGAGAPVLLAMHLKRIPCPHVRVAGQAAAVAFTAARFLFAANAWREMPFLPFVKGPMLTSYAALFAMCGILVAI